MNFNVVDSFDFLVVVTLAWAFLGFVYFLSKISSLNLLRVSSFLKSAMNSQQLIDSVSHKLNLLANADESAIKHAENEYVKKNAQLKEEIAALKAKLVKLELIGGHIQYFVPHVTESLVHTNEELVSEKPNPVHAKPTDSAPKAVGKQPKPTPSQKNSGGGGGRKGGAAPAGDLPVDVSRLDLRVGKIVEVERHPDADSLYIEKVDLGEGHLRTIISGLVNFVPIEKMQGLVGIFMCNLKPVKMRGIESQGMLMCASNDEHTVVEPLVIEGPNPPELGDRVFVESYPGEPDDQLNPKKKVWETVKPDMRVDASNFATYKGVHWKLRNNPSAVIKSPSVVNAQIS
nr:aminoacyl tRNA synthase complex interacting [Hymenolepis microstoma]